MCTLLGIGILAMMLYQFRTDLGLIAQRNLSTTVKNQVNQNLPAKNTNLLKDIQQAHLFGKASKKQPKKQQLPETRLQLTLIGTFLESVSGQSSALIAKKGKASIRYFSGDKITKDTLLSSVYENHVTLERDGVEEALYFNFTKPRDLPHDTLLRQRLKKERALRKHQAANSPQTNTTTNSQTSDRLEKLKQFNKNL